METEFIYEFMLSQMGKGNNGNENDAGHELKKSNQFSAARGLNVDLPEI